MAETDADDSAARDMWSLGCVYSEAAVWVARGPEGLEDHRHKLRLEVNRLSSIIDGPEDLNRQIHHSDVTRQPLRQLLSSVEEESDIVTKSVCKEVIEGMLDPPDQTFTLRRIWNKAQDVISDGWRDYIATLSRAARPFGLRASKRDKNSPTISKHSTSMCSLTTRTESYTPDREHRTISDHSGSNPRMSLKGRYEFTCTIRGHRMKLGTHSFTPRSASTCEQHIERYVRDERDYKSLAVKEYDPFQDAAKALHREQLSHVVRQIY
jgi:hypothetical protein